MAKVTPEQRECFLSYMENHSGFAAHKFMGLDGTAQRHEQFGRLKVMLDALGPEKSIESWSRYWNTLKGDARLYNAKNNKKLRKTGNHDDQIIQINDIYERVLNIIGRSHGNGLALIPEMGITSRKVTYKETRPSSGHSYPALFSISNCTNNNVSTIECGQSSSPEVRVKTEVFPISINQDIPYYLLQPLKVKEHIQEKDNEISLVDCTFNTNMTENMTQNQIKKENVTIKCTHQSNSIPHREISKEIKVNCQLIAASPELVVTSPMKKRMKFEKDIVSNMAQDITNPVQAIRKFTSIINANNVQKQQFQQNVVYLLGEILNTLKNLQK